jgi:uncharacterized membrane protein
MIKTANSTRIESIDLLRGIVMIVMALDHVRDYFHADAFLFNPTDLTKTSVALFFTRWITHYCAPVFIFLAGTSAFLIGMRKSKKELSSFLLKRGLWLVFLELTVVNFAWFFNVEFSLITLFVIWALGIGMILLAAFIHLPYMVTLAAGLIMVAGHNMLDGFNVEGNDIKAIGWSIIHQFQGFSLSENFSLFIAYPLVPWVGVMLLGYCFGIFYQSEFVATRKKLLLSLGFGLILLFVVIRLNNVYGDPSPWTFQSSTVFTVLSFINVTKYPPSLLYLLITLGPAIVFLAVSENFAGAISQRIKILGRVPMFYYLLHLYLIHFLAVIAALISGYEASDMVFTSWVTDSPNLAGYGFNLWIVYAVWIGVVVMLYPLCKWYDQYRMAHQRTKWWLSYV